MGQFAPAILVPLLLLGLPDGYIRGVVRFVDGTPLPYGMVVLTGTSIGAMTHADGSFSMGGVPTGTATLRITATGWHGERIQLVEVLAGRTTKVTVELADTDLVRDPEISIREFPSLGTVRGFVRDADTDAPVPYVGAHVVQGPRFAMTDSDGTFVIDGVEPGTVKFMASMPRYNTAVLDSVVVAADSVTYLDVRIMRIWPAPNVPGEPIAGPAADAARADPSRPFTVDLPRGWFAKAANYSVMHYRDVFAVVNNRSPALRVTDKTLPNGRTHSTDTVADQLEPGTCYIDFATFEGPGRSARYRPGREDSFDRALAAFLKNRKPERSTSLLDEYVLRFIKWGSQWDVRVYCRKPYTRQERDLALDVLRSIRFFERPIVNGAQAVGLAIQFLPPEAQIPKDSDDLCAAGEAWLANGGQYGNRTTRITKSDEGFEVTFVFHEDGVGGSQDRRWEYLVRWDGEVEPR